MMRNLIAVTFLLLIISNRNVHSQINIGVKAGLNMNDKLSKIEQTYNIPATPAPTKTKLGYHFGVTISYELSNSFSLNSGILYVNKGSSLDLQEFYGRPESSWDTSTKKLEGHSRENYDYLELPLQLSYKIWKGLRIYAGPYAAVGVSGRYNDDYTMYKNGKLDFEYKRNKSIKPIYTEKKLNVPTNDGGLHFRTELPREFNGIDYGVNLGIGYELGNFILSSEYSLGLGNVKAKYTNVSRDIHRHRVLYFSLGYVVFKR